MGKLEAELKKAIKKGDHEAVKNILSQDIPLDAELPGKVTALEFALAAEQRGIAQDLLDRGARPRKQKNNNLLLDVPKFRDLGLLQRLVELGADVHAGDRTGHTPLLIAVAAGYYDAVRYLLELGADATVRNENGRSVFDLLKKARDTAEFLLPGSEGELAELFRSQLTDLNKIEELLNATLTADQTQKLMQKPSEEPVSATSWQLNGDIEFRLEIAPFPFTSRKKSRLEGRLTRFVPSWESHFQENEGHIYFRVRHLGEDGTWASFHFGGRDGGFLFFTAETKLPPGKLLIDIKFDSDQGIVDGEIQGWEIEVDPR